MPHAPAATVRHRPRADDGLPDRPPGLQPAPGPPASAAGVTAAGGPPYSLEEDHHLAAIAREVIVQVWETTERNIFRSAGARVMVKGERMERVYRDLSVIVSHRNTGFRDPVFRLFGTVRLDAG